MVGRPREPARRPSTYLRMNRLAAWMACSNLRERLPCSKASGSQPGLRTVEREDRKNANYQVAQVWRGGDKR